MKTAYKAFIASGVALAAVGGGTAYALTTADAEPTAVVQTETPAPEVSDEPTQEATEGVTPEEAPTPEATPTDPPEVEHTNAEQDYIAVMKQEAAVDGLYPTDAEVLSWGTYSCEQFAAGLDRSEIQPPTGEDHPVLGNIARTKALELLCPDQG